MDLLCPIDLVRRDVLMRIFINESALNMKDGPGRSFYAIDSQNCASGLTGRIGDIILSDLKPRLHPQVFFKFLYVIPPLPTTALLVNPDFR